MTSAGAPDVVLDDDPTGVQALRDVPVLLDWSVARLRAIAATQPHAIHLMTNLRALDPPRALTVAYSAAAAAHAALPRSRIVLRGDSTLRGHLYEEYQAVWRASGADRPPVLLLVPALPAAGRVTVDGVHWLVDGHGRRALHETEYAHDGCFAYRSARLLEWAQERSHGELAAADGVEVALARLREGGSDTVRDAIMSAAVSGRPAACVPDAETVDDLQLIAAGCNAAQRAGAQVVVRCAPTFAGVISGTLADGNVAAPRPGDRGLLVVCGSYVSTSTRQLAHLESSLQLPAVEPDVTALASAHPAEEVARVAQAAQRQLTDRGLALVSTPRRRPPSLTGLDAGQRIVRGLAAIVAALHRLPGVVIAKGGITSHVVLRHGLGALEARVAGPVAPGVALWTVATREGEVEYLVFPGNVGGPDHLTNVVTLVTGR